MICNPKKPFKFHSNDGQCDEIERVFVAPRRRANVTFQAEVGAPSSGARRIVAQCVSIDEFRPKSYRLDGTSQGSSRACELALEIIGKVYAIVDDVRLIDRENWISRFIGFTRYVAMMNKRHQFRGLVYDVAQDLRSCFGGSRALAPFRPP